MDKARLAARVRLVSGIILSFFVMTHLLTHMVGLISLAAMEEANKVFTGFWHLPLLSWLVPICLVLHAGFAVAWILSKKSLRMKRREAIQVVLGITIPTILLVHIVATRGVELAYGIEVNYSKYFLVDFTNTLVAMGSLTIITCAHAWMGFQRRYRQRSWFAGTAAIQIVLVSTLAIGAILGATKGAREVQRHKVDQTWLGQLVGGDAKSPEELHDFQYKAGPLAVTAYLMILGVALVWRQRRQKGSGQKHQRQDPPLRKVG